MSDAGFSGYLTINDVRKILKGFYPKFDEKQFSDKCREFNLDENKKIKELSTGMKAKLNVLCALTHDPKLLILDEPTAGLDVMARDEILTMLREFMEEDPDRSILISSHISSDLESLCDDFYMIDQETGKQILVGIPTDSLEGLLDLHVDPAGKVMGLLVNGGNTENAVKLMAYLLDNMK